MKYVKESALAALLALSACHKEHKNYEPYKDETLLNVIEEKLDYNLWVQVVESKRPDITSDTKYKISLTNEAGEKYAFFLGVDSEANCRNKNSFGLIKIEIKTAQGTKNLCDYIKAKRI